MTTLKFKNKDQADTIAGIIDFSLNLINPGEIKKLNYEMYEYTSKLKKHLLFQQDNEIIYLKNDDDILFVIDNSIWILSQEIKIKSNKTYSNSIELMKQLKSLINSKIKKSSTKSKAYDKLISRDFIFISDYIFNSPISGKDVKLPIVPKKDEIWYIKSHHEKDTDNTLVICNKDTGNEFIIKCSEFEEMSKLVT